MRIRTSAVVGLLLLAPAAVIAPAATAMAAPAAAAVRLDVTVPQVIATGRNETGQIVVTNPNDAPADLKLRINFRPAAGSPVRPLENVLTISVANTRLSPTKVGDIVSATTLSRTIPANSTQSFPLALTIQPAISTGRIPSSSVSVTADALDISDALLASSPARAVTMLEPLTKLTGWPAQVKAQVPFVVTTTTTNTTPYRHALTSPALYLGRSGNETVKVEVKNGQQWQPVSLHRQYFWLYAPQYVSIDPGKSYTAQLRITFDTDVQAPVSGNADHVLYAYAGPSIALDSRPYTQVPR